MSKSFKNKMIETAAGGMLSERLSYGGHFPNINSSTAVVEDWTFALQEAMADVAQEVRHFSNPDTGDLARKAARKHLAELATIAEAMAGRISRL